MEIETWKSVTIGQMKFAEACSKLHAAGVSTRRADLLKIVDEQRNRAKLDLVLVSSADLGLETGVSYNQVIEAAHARNWSLCDPDVALQLFIQHLDCLVWGNTAHVMMEPLQRDEGEMVVFDVGHYHAPYRWERHFIFDWPIKFLDDVKEYDRFIFVKKVNEI